jgi:leucine dehydrogenase
MNLAEFLYWAGADLILSDIDSEKLDKAAHKYGARTLSPKEILFAECDVLSPCALGAILNDTTIPQLRCKAIAGAANNQLLTPNHAEILRRRNILYVPDFVINVGGILNVAEEIEPNGYNPIQSRSKVHRIYDTVTSIYEIADRKNTTTHNAAIALADYRIKYGLGKRVVQPTFHHFAEK